MSDLTQTPVNSSSTMEGAGTPADATTGETAALSPESQESQHAKPSTEPTGAKPANALTPPTSEEMNHEETTKEQDESELSDLDLEDEEEEIKPDHYWEGGKIPVFKPTMDQFRDFSKFIAKVDQYGMKSGIVKVIPPDEWYVKPDLEIPAAEPHANATPQARLTSAA